MTTTSLERAASFMATNARVLDRRRFDHLVGEGNAEATKAALDAYRNGDGGYGRGLEPDLRAVESQPAGALHAFEVIGELGDACEPEAVALCDWLWAASLDDGGLPFALPVGDPSGCAPFWADADPKTSSLHITAAVAGYAHTAARVVPALSEHRWLRRCTRHCMEAIAARAQPMHALELKFCLSFLDAVVDLEPGAGAQLERLGSLIPPSGELHVAGGLEDEMMRPLDFAPEPGRPVRGLFTKEAIDKDLDRVEGGQAEDGGWPLGWQAYSPAAAVEWRGYVTLEALHILKNNERI